MIISSVEWIHRLRLIWGESMGSTRVAGDAIARTLLINHGYFNV